MKKIDSRFVLKGLLVFLKIILAIPCLVLFVLIRCVQFFLKLCGPVVSFICIVSAVMISLGGLAEIFLQMHKGVPGVPAIIVTFCIAGVLGYIPIVGVPMVMVVLEAACSWIWKFYMGDSKNWKSFYKRPDYEWSAFEGGYKGKDTNTSELHFHYFKGVKTQEELKKRYYALMRIYHPDNAFGEDEITRSIMEEYEYLQNKLQTEDVRKG